MFKVSKEIIESVKPIEGADRLHLATIRGWEIVVSKTVNVGDVVIYFPIDSVLPKNLEDKIFEGTKVKLHNGRVRATKIRGVYSYGLTCSVIHIPFSCKIGEDIAAKIGVVKYEQPVIEMTAKVKTGICLKTNPRFRVYPKFYHYQDSINLFKNSESLIISEKCHGMNIRFGWIARYSPSLFTRLMIKLGLTSKYEWCVGSHNTQRNPESNEVFCNLARTYKLKDFLKQYPEIILYGEMIGTGVQNNYSYGFKDKKLVIFDMIHNNGQHCEQGFIKLFAEKIGAIYPEQKIVTKEWLNNPEFGQSFIDPNTTIEGWVIRDQNDQAKKAKIINPEYLVNKNNTDFH